ncbi:MAG: hypothetical protein Q8O46_00700 [bacterium]|nr:hypothetical protein [bacterium]
MPSKHAGEDLRKTIKSIRDGTFEYENQEPKKTNWIQYDYAQIKEIAYYLENLRDLVEEADKRIQERTLPKKRGPGRPPIESSDIAKVLLLQTYTASPNRVAEGLLLLFREKLRISEHFSYKTIERGYDRGAVNEILDEIVEITNGSVEGKETQIRRIMQLKGKCRTPRRMIRNRKQKVVNKIMIVFQNQIQKWAFPMPLWVLEFSIS